ncbi:hypothetical protein AACH10_13750 [Ideonella sp. DXS22W]|uniref:Uncharacterized protein n=1 Tax=Pseudaquabacterium inlustre TaxID=2984192 RepID=A0ABU9CHH6_9BURK
MSTRPDDPADAAGMPDPTHALDDFLRRMRPTSPPAAGADDDLIDLSGLTARLNPERSTAAARHKGGTLRNGERWTADDVTDVPVVELPRVPPAAAADAAQNAALLDGIGRAASAAAAQAAEASAQATVDWQPDPQALQLRRTADPRVLPRWQPGAWIGAQREVLAASTEFVTPAGAAPGTAPVVESYEAQRLLVLWAPPGLDAPHPGRWPRLVLLAPLPAEAAADALLAARPAEAAEAPLWLDPDAGHVDWALAAEIALHHVSALRPFQIDGLRAFIEAEREASFGRINDAYTAVGSGAVARR